jgi:hypothetical protein
MIHVCERLSESSEVSEPVVSLRHADSGAGKKKCC